MSVAVQARDLVVRYEDFVALDGVTFELANGEALGVVGPNGSGKSTLLKTIAGLVPRASGELLVLDADPARVPAGAIAYVPQVESVDWSFPATVRDVVAMGRFPRLPFWRFYGAGDRAAVERALDAVNMSALSHRPIAELSGGQQQRVFVAASTPVVGSSRSRSRGSCASARATKTRCCCPPESCAMGRCESALMFTASSARSTAARSPAP